MTCVHERFKGKKIKVVWQDMNQSKAVYGVLIDVVDGFLIVKADAGNELTILASAVLTISEKGDGQ